MISGETAGAGAVARVVEVRDCPLTVGAAADEALAAEALTGAAGEALSWAAGREVAGAGGSDRADAGAAAMAARGATTVLGTTLVADAAGTRLITATVHETTSAAPAEIIVV